MAGKASKRRGRRQLNALVDGKVARRFRDYCRNQNTGRDAKLQEIIERFLQSALAPDQHIFISLRDDIAERFRVYRLAARRPDRGDVMNDALDDFITSALEDSRLREQFDSLMAAERTTVH